MTPEGAVVKAALHYLTLRGVFAWRNQTGALRSADGERFVKFGFRGSADILGITADGRFVACECKAGKGKLSSYQREFLEHIRQRGGVGIVVTESDYQQVIDEALEVTA